MKCNNNAALCLLLLAAFWALLYRLGDADFYHLRNESRRARIAQEMLETGSTLIPHLEGTPILTKPPLYYWSILLLSGEKGVTEGTARLPSAVSGILILCLTVLLGRLFFNNSVAISAGFILLSTNFFLHQARYAEIEAMLALFITASIYFFFRGYARPLRSSGWFTLSFLMMGLGMMTKGPYAVSFPLLPITCWLLVYCNKKLLYSTGILPGILVFIVVTLPWPIAVAVQYPDFFHIVFLETAGRTITGFAHREPFYYYFAELVSLFFPWIAFLPLSAACVFSKKISGWKKENVFLLMWFTINLLFLSLSKSKRGYYLFPLTPAAALLLASTWQAVWEWLREKTPLETDRLIKIVFLAGALLAGASFFAGNPFAVNFPEMHFPETAPFLFFTGCAMMASSVIKTLRPSLTGSTIVLGCLTCLMLLSQLLYVTYTVPIRNSYDSGKQFYRQAAKIVPRNTSLSFLCAYENYTFTFYAQRPVITLTDHQELIDYMQSPKTAYAVVTNKILKKIQPVPWRTVFRSNHCEHGSWNGYSLMKNN